MPVDLHDFKIVKRVDAATPPNAGSFAVDPANPDATMSEKDWIIIESYTSGASQGPRPDGTSNTLMIAERYQDGPYVLTAIEHGAVDTFQKGFNGGSPPSLAAM